MAVQVSLVVQSSSPVQWIETLK